MVTDSQLSEPLLSGEEPNSYGDTWHGSTRVLIPNLDSEEDDELDEHSALVGPPQDETSKMIAEAKAQLGLVRSCFPILCPYVRPSSGTEAGST